VLASFSLSIHERYMQELNTLLLLRHTTTAATTMLPISMMRLVVNYRRYVNLLKKLSSSERERGALCEIFKNYDKNTNKSGIHSAEISYSLKALFRLSYSSSQNPIPFSIGIFNEICKRTVRHITKLAGTHPGLGTFPNIYKAMNNFNLK
jgi:hypothetical protein